MSNLISFCSSHIQMHTSCTYSNHHPSFVVTSLKENFCVFFTWNYWKNGNFTGVDNILQFLSDLLKACFYDCNTFTEYFHCKNVSVGENIVQCDSFFLLQKKRKNLSYTNNCILALIFFKERKEQSNTLLNLPIWLFKGTLRRKS